MFSTKEYLMHVQLNNSSDEKSQANTIPICCHILFYKSWCNISSSSFSSVYYTPHWRLCV